jgi:hypothetical protein
MKPKEFLFNAITSATSTDYESADLIWEQIAGWAKDEGQVVTKEQMLDPLCEMAGSGLVASYIYSKEKDRYERFECRRELMSDLWFMSRERSNRFA